MCVDGGGGGIGIIMRIVFMCELRGDGGVVVVVV